MLVFAINKSNKWRPFVHMGVIDEYMRQIWKRLIVVKRKKTYFMFKVRTCQKLSKAGDIRHNQILQYLGYAFTVMLTSIKRFKAIACTERKGHLPILLRSRWKNSVKCAQHCSLLMLSVCCCSFPVYIKECKYYSPQYIHQCSFPQNHVPYHVHTTIWCGYIKSPQRNRHHQYIMCVFFFFSDCLCCLPITPQSKVETISPLSSRHFSQLDIWFMSRRKGQTFVFHIR